MRLRPLLTSLAAGLILAGCTAPVRPPQPELAVKVDGLVAEFEVLGATAPIYLWDFGDGTTQETRSPKAAHTYEQPGVYAVKVEGVGMGYGTGLPGPGDPTSPVVLFTLSAVVDTRPPFEITDIVVTVVDPPYWYKPGTWPENHFPGNTHLNFRLAYVARRDDAAPMKVRWTVFDGYSRPLEYGEGVTWTWLEAESEFRVYGCPGGKTQYNVFVQAILKNGTVVTEHTTIYACPPKGCG